MSVPPDRRRPRVYRGWWIVGVSYYSQLVSGSAAGWTFGVLIEPMQADLGWSRSAIVGVLTLMSLIAGVLSVQLGGVIDRHGTRMMMVISAIIAGAALMAVATTRDIWFYYACWAAFGLALPGIGVLAPRVVIANWFVRRRPLAFVIFTLGAATAGVVVAPIMAWVAETWGWRTAWGLLGISAWVIAPLAWFIVRRRPEDIGLLPDGDLAVAERGVTSSGDISGPSSGLTSTGPAPIYEAPWTVGEALRTRAYWLVTLGFALVSLPAGGIFVFIVPHVVSKGHSLAAGATVVSIYGIGTLVGRPIWGWVLTRYGIYRSMVAFGSIYGAAIALYGIPESLLGIRVAIFVLGVAIAGASQLMSQVLPDYYGRGIVGTITGYSTLVFTLSRGIAPLSAALIFDTTSSYAIAFGTFSVACFLASVAFYFAPPPRHASEREPCRSRGS